jgi:hypothetical protein
VSHIRLLAWRLFSSLELLKLYRNLHYFYTSQNWSVVSTLITAEKQCIGK